MPCANGTSILMKFDNIVNAVSYIVNWHMPYQQSSFTGHSVMQYLMHNANAE